MLTTNKITVVCDKVTAFCIYATIFFLPIASAITESLFGIIILSYVVKRGAIFFPALKDSIGLSFPNIVKLFLRSYAPVESALKKPVIRYIFIGFLSVLISHYPLLSLKAFFFKLLQSTFLYFLFVEVINSRERLGKFFMAFFASMTLVVTDGISQYFLRVEFVHGHPINDGRVTSCFSHANELGSYLVMIIPILFCLSAFFSTSFKNKQKSKTPLLIKFFQSQSFKYIATGLFVMAVICLGLTYSRGAWVAIFAGFLLLGFKKPKLLIGLLMAVILFGAIFIPKMMSERTTNIIAGGVFTSSDRFNYWISAADIITRKPVLGTGLNTYTNVSNDFRVAHAVYPHNGYLHMAAEIGLVGLAAFLAILYSLFKNGFASLRKVDDRFFYELLLGGLAGFCAFLVSAFFDTTFYTIQLETLLWLMISFLAVVSLRAEEWC